MELLISLVIIGIIIYGAYAANKESIEEDKEVVVIIPELSPEVELAAIEEDNTIEPLPDVVEDTKKYTEEYVEKQLKSKKGAVASANNNMKTKTIMKSELHDSESSVIAKKPRVRKPKTKKEE